MPSGGKLVNWLKVSFCTGMCKLKALLDRLSIEIPTKPENTTYNNTSMKIHHADDYFYNVNLFMMKQPLL